MMSKYVRTRLDTIEDLDKIIFDAAFTREDYIKNVVVKEANTIEELCDCFIVNYQKTKTKKRRTKMNKELIVKVLIQLQPDLAKEFAYAILEDNKKLKALEIIKEKEMLSVFQDINGKYFIAFNNTAIEIPQEEYGLLKEVLL